MDITSVIIDRIRRNRISTSEITDCLGRSGALPGVLPINSRHFCVGRVYWCFAAEESSWTMHQQLAGAGDGDVVIVDTFNCGGRAVLGALTAKFLLLYRQATAVVVKGLVRDIPFLVRENFPVWSQGRSPVGCFSREADWSMHSDAIQRARAQYEGAIAVCDDSGVVVVPAYILNADFLQALDDIEALEDTWFDCIDRLKWSTFDTVCLKRYRKE